MRRKSPFAIQQWVDSLPVPAQENKKDSTDIMTDKSGNNSNNLSISPQNQNISPNLKTTDLRGILSRDASFQSDDASSYCSSVESVLESRRPDPEAVLLGLGFGPSVEQDETARIPKRFLQPSKLAGVDVDRFLQQQREAKEAASNYYWPQMHSSLNIGREINKDIPFGKDSSSFNSS